MAEGGDNWKNAQSIYEFKAPDIDGNIVDLSKYKQKRNYTNFLTISKF